MGEARGPLEDSFGPFRAVCDTDAVFFFEFLKRFTELLIIPDKRFGKRKSLEGIEVLARQREKKCNALLFFVKTIPCPLTDLGEVFRGIEDDVPLVFRRIITDSGLLDYIQYCTLFRVNYLRPGLIDEGKRHSRFFSPSGPTDPVGIVFNGLRQIIVNDVRHVRDIQAPAGNIGGK